VYVALLLSLSLVFLFAVKCYTRECVSGAERGGVTDSRTVHWACSRTSHWAWQPQLVSQGKYALSTCVVPNGMPIAASSFDGWEENTTKSAFLPQAPLKRRRLPTSPHLRGGRSQSQGGSFESFSACSRAEAEEGEEQDHPSRLLQSYPNIGACFQYLLERDWIFPIEIYCLLPISLLACISIQKSAHRFSVTMPDTCHLSINSAYAVCIFPISHSVLRRCQDASDARLVAFYMMSCDHDLCGIVSGDRYAWLRQDASV